MLAPTLALLVILAVGAASIGVGCWQLARPEQFTNWTHHQVKANRLDGFAATVVGSGLILSSLAAYLRG